MTNQYAPSATVLAASPFYRKRRRKLIRSLRQQVNLVGKVSHIRRCSAGIVAYDGVIIGAIPIMFGMATPTTGIPKAIPQLAPLWACRRLEAARAATSPHAEGDIDEA